MIRLQSKQGLTKVNMIQLVVGVEVEVEVYELTKSNEKQS